MQVSALATLTTINSPARTLTPLAQANINPGNTSKNLSLKIAGYPFPRVAALADARVKIEGCDIVFAKGKIGDMNTEVFRGKQTYDITEIGLHPFMLAYANISITFVPTQKCLYSY